MPGCWLPGWEHRLRSCHDREANEPSWFLGTRARWGETEWTLITIWGGFFSERELIGLCCNARVCGQSNTLWLPLSSWNWKFGGRGWPAAGGQAGGHRSTTASGYSWSGGWQIYPFTASLIKNASPKNPEKGSSLSWGSGDRGVMETSPYNCRVCNRFQSNVTSSLIRSSPKPY